MTGYISKRKRILLWPTRNDAIQLCGYRLGNPIWWHEGFLGVDSLCCPNYTNAVLVRALFL